MSNIEEAKDARKTGRRIPGLTSDLISDKALESAAEDEFQHAPLARLVAQIVSDGDTPLNIALYGSWGSGKSSFFALLKEELDDSVAVVKYNAWKYGGEALQRRFIADGARQLDIEIPDLYGSRERAEAASVPLRERLKTIGHWVWTALVPLVLVGICVYVAFAGGLALVTSSTFTGLLNTLSKAALAPAAVVAMLVWAGRFMLSESLTRVQLRAPQQEQLEDAFAAVLGKAREATKNLVQKRFERFVFFVDELDRCAAEEVVSTLAAIRNFLDQPDCVFIVAADRDVLEVALTKLPQENPANEDTPYYSSASEFLDKIFQTQLSLPPLRDQRRTRFARDLVLSKQHGVWSELRTHGAGILDDVIFVLIPSHVRSPRRIKVLLNTFAINVRTAEARGIDWRDRATEIAKLTVFETEFPLFAADLHVDSRLPSLLLDGAVGKTLSQRSRRVLAKHRLRGDDARELPGDVPTGAQPAEQAEPLELEPTDRLLTGDKREREALIGAQREQLGRYLETRRSFPDPRPDLLYLEDAGRPFGLDDPSLAMTLELDAPESPEVVIAALEGRTADELSGAARLLASMVPQHVGPEKDSVFSTLVGVTDLLSDRVLQPIGGEIEKAIEEFLTSGRVVPKGVLVAALRTSALVGARPASKRLLRDGRLVEDPELLSEAGSRVAPLLESDDRKELFGHIAASYAAEDDDDGPLLALLTKLPISSALELLEQPTIWTTIGRLDAAEVDRAFEALFEAAEHRDADSLVLQRAIQWRALRRAAGGGYPSARKRAAVVLAAPANQGVAARHGIVALQTAPSGDWEFWGQIVASAPATSNFDADTRAAVIALISAFRASSEHDQPAATNAATAALTAGGYDPTADGRSDQITRALTASLSEPQWWASPSHTDAQQAVHTFALAVASACPALRPDIEEALEEDLARSLASAPSAQALTGIATMGVRLSPAAATRLSTVCEEAQTQFPEQSLATRLALARSIREGGGDVDESAFGLDAIRAARTAGTSRALSDWLYLRPRASDVLTLAGEIAIAATGAEIEAFASWAQDASSDERADLVNAAITGSSDGARWIESIPHPVNEERVVMHISKLVSDLSRHEERDTAVRALIALRPEGAAAQRSAASVIVDLLGRGKQADFETALRGIRALRAEHQSKGRLIGALRQAADDLDRKIPTRVVADLNAIGITLPEKYVEKPKKKGIRGRLGFK